MPGQTLTFPNYSPARYAALKSDLLAKGLDLEGNVGEVKKFGADVSYAYDGAANLTLLVRSAPHFHSMSAFVDGLSAAVNGVQ
jgi:hypothetical protein